MLEAPEASLGPAEGRFRCVPEVPETRLLVGGDVSMLEAPEPCLKLADATAEVSGSAGLCSVALFSVALFCVASIRGGFCCARFCCARFCCARFCCARFCCA